MAHSSHARFAQRVRRRHEAELHLLPPGLPDAAAMSQVSQVLQQNGLRFDQALRVLRQLVLERLLTLDCDENAPLDQITGCMTLLAEFALRLPLLCVLLRMLPHLRLRLLSRLLLRLLLSLLLRTLPRQNKLQLQQQRRQQQQQRRQQQDKEHQHRRLHVPRAVFRQSMLPQ